MAEIFEAILRDFPATREPDPGQGLHPRDQPVQHRDPERPAGDERVHADVEVRALAVLGIMLRPNATQLSHTLEALDDYEHNKKDPCGEER